MSDKGCETTIDRIEVCDNVGCKVHPNTSTRIKDLQRQVWQTADDKGWHDEQRTVGDYISLIHSELSEALEEFRNGRNPDEVYESNGKPEGIPIELADVVIRVLEFSETFGIDLEDAIKTKILFNETRPHRHGGKVI